MDDLTRALTPDIPREEGQGQVSEPDQSNNPPATDVGQSATPDPAQSEGQGQSTEPTENKPAEEFIPKSQYDELRKAYTQKAMEAADMKRSQPAQVVQQPVQYQPVQPQQPSQQFAGMPNIQKAIAQQTQEVQRQYDEKLNEIQRQTRSLDVNVRLTSLQRQNPEEFDAVAPKLAEAMGAMSPEELHFIFDSPNGVETAYKSLAADYYKEQAQARVIATGQHKAEVDKAAQAVKDSSGNVAAKEPPVSEAQKIADSILSVADGGSIFFR